MKTASCRQYQQPLRRPLRTLTLNIKSRGTALKRQAISPNTCQRVHTFCIACSLPEMAPPIVRWNEYAQSACKQMLVDCPRRKHWAQDVSGYPGCEPQLPSEAAFSCPQLPSDSEAFFLLPSEALVIGILSSKLVFGQQLAAQLTAQYKCSSGLSCRQKLR